VVIETARIRDESRKAKTTQHWVDRDARPFHRTPMINTNDNNTPAGPRLSIRVDGDNRLHHLWNNNGTWWLHYTEHLPDFTKRRVRRSLRTHDLELAIQRRDAWLTAA
jgi:hypothetical protein